jgi:thioredoxin 1
MNANTFEVTAANFAEQVQQSTLPVLLDFTADWCPPCKMLEPIVNEIADKYVGSLRVGKVDGDAQPELIAQYQVFGLPTLILFLKGEPVLRLVGFKPRDKIEAQLRAHVTLETA